MNSMWSLNRLLRTSWTGTGRCQMLLLLLLSASTKVGEGERKKAYALFHGRPCSPTLVSLFLSICLCLNNSSGTNNYIDSSNRVCVDTKAQVSQPLD